MGTVIRGKNERQVYLINRNINRAALLYQLTRVRKQGTARIKIDSAGQTIIIAIRMRPSFFEELSELRPDEFLLPECYPDAVRGVREILVSPSRP